MEITTGYKNKFNILSKGYELLTPHFSDGNWNHQHHEKRLLTYLSHKFYFYPMMFQFFSRNFQVYMDLFKEAVKYKDL